MQKKLLISAIVILVLIVTLVFVWQKKQSGEALDPVTIVKSDTTQEKTYPQNIEVIQGTNEAWYSLPEYGVRMRLNKEFAENLIYIFVHEKNVALNEEWDAVYFSTKSLTAIDEGCSPEEGNPLGAITKTKGSAAEIAKTEEFYSSRLRDIVQIGEYHYMWMGPQATCWDPKNDDAIQKVRGAEVYRAIQDGVKTIQLIPSK
ncbi:MAG: hypothetical protein KBD27_01055 [Candidatus Moranbacteria bacterium]|nr:hypothetical protein [Candidatus Moranbacteria bacterium]